MSYISKSLRQKVHVRANNCCEYCLTSQKISGAQMHIEHIIARVHSGSSEYDNLCLSCAWCNSYKGEKIEGIDPVTKQTVSLFHPRKQKWAEHFSWSTNGIQVVGLTPIGRVTVLALKMNNEYIVVAREYWVRAGWHPPQ